jgi:hypothetical protein
MRPSGTRRAPPLPAIFFSAPTHPFERPAHGGFAHCDPARPPQELAPLTQRRCRVFFEISLQESLGGTAELRLEPRALLGGEWASLIAAKQRTGSEDHNEVQSAADTLLEKLPGENDQ